jgi:hypothetical protein
VSTAAAHQCEEQKDTRYYSCETVRFKKTGKAFEKQLNTEHMKPP